ncbi:MAG: SpoIIE family protein phosphatase [Planctomycetes bacterium]|nr:SpoIIE family protein phosphatase [Planctomycetota bacterium]
MQTARILVVDDEPGMLHGVERVLGARYRVTACRTAEEALAAVHERAPDLAILDIRMPGPDGFELAARLREVVPDLDVIYMTGVVHELDAQLIRAIQEKAFFFIQKPFDREVLLALVRRCLEVRELAAQNRRYTELLESEMASARAFQLGMLPARSAKVEGVAVDGLYETCEALGGDFFDHIPAGRGKLAFLQADVSGHGVRAALLVGVLKAAFHDAADAHHRPREVLRRIGKGLQSFDDGSFVTVFCGLVDTRAGTLAWANAGHPPALLWGGERTLEELPRTGLVISPALDDLDWEERSVPFGPDDVLLVCTDGVHETRGEGGAFGRERLRGTVAGCGERGAALLRRVVDEVVAFRGGRPQDDDLSLLTLRRT